MNRPLFTLLLLSALVLFLAVVFRAPAPVDNPAVEERQGPAPDFSLEAVGGGRVSLAELRGRWVLVNFWATWCEPCLQELPELARLAQNSKGRQFSLVLAAADESPRQVLELAARLERLVAEGRISAQMAPLARDTAALVRGGLAGTYSLSDPEGVTARRYGTEKYPETYLIDPQGRLRLVFIGAHNWSGEKTARLLEPFFHGGQE